MRRTILLYLLLCVAMLAGAQDKMIVEMTDGTKTEFDVSKILRISFETSQQEQGEYVPNSIKDGVRIKAVGRLKLYYDSNGKLDEVDGWGYKTYRVNEDFTAMTGGNEEKWIDITDIVRNGDGYIVSCNLKITKMDNGQAYEQFSGPLSITYDGDGHMTKIYTSMQGFGSYGNLSMTKETVFSYSNGVITNAKFTETTDDYCKVRELTYSGSEVENKYEQFAPLITESIIEKNTDAFTALAYAGYLGKWSKRLPTVAVGYFNSGDGKSPTKETYNIEYILNSNGTIHSVDYFGDSYIYEY